MKNKLLNICPSCQNKLFIKTISCKECGLEINGDFENKSNAEHESKLLLEIDDKEREFLETFLIEHGNFKNIQKVLDISYPTAKKRLDTILVKLELKEEEGRAMITKKIVDVKESDSLVVKTIKEKLNSKGGYAEILLQRGGICDIYYSDKINGLASSKIPYKELLIFDVFDSVVEFVMKNGGKAKKGSAQSKGVRLGDDNYHPDKTISGYVAKNVYGKLIGESGNEPGFVIYAILDWAGICFNKNGYVEMNEGFVQNIGK